MYIKQNEGYKPFYEQNTLISRFDNSWHLILPTHLRQVLLLFLFSASGHVGTEMQVTYFPKITELVTVEPDVIHSSRNPELAPTARLSCL